MVILLDMFGNPLNVGDTVIYANYRGIGMLHPGRIYRITSDRISIVYLYKPSDDYGNYRMEDDKFLYKESIFKRHIRTDDSRTHILKYDDLRTVD